MDCCTSGRGRYDNLTQLLLNHLGVDRIDLLVLSHPDLDHVQGFAELINDRTRPVTRLWRYPAMVRDLVARVTRTSANPRHLELADALHRIDKVVRRGDLEHNEVRTRTEAEVGRPACRVVAIAPTTYDAMRMEAQFQRLMSSDGAGDWTASERLVDALSGQRTWSDNPNVASLALVIEWQGFRVVLAGDVENGVANERSGWKGAIRTLQGAGKEQDWTDLVRDVDFVKVSHHGSKRSHAPEVWALHAENRKVPNAGIAPFSSSNLPAGDVLSDLRAHVVQLGLTADEGGALGRAHASGWTSSASSTPLSTEAPLLVLSVDASGSCTVHAGRSAHLLS